MGIIYNKKGEVELAIAGKRVPTAREVGEAGVNAAKKFAEAHGAIGSVLGEFAREKFSSSPKKGKTMVEGMLDKIKGKPTSLKKGGIVKKTGYVKLHKGEKVIPASKVKKAKKKAKKGKK